MPAGRAAPPLPLLLLLLLLAAGPLLLGSGGVAGASNPGLACYQCNVTDNLQCGEPLPCPTDQAYDRCRTTIRRRGGGVKTIIKDCTLGKCWLDGGATSALGLDQCDTSRPNVECVHCCEESGCNASSAQRRRTLAGAVAAVILLSILIQML
ncbi:uncharacterized protein LOC119090433 [Pollicipes pollicipes]|uniref:uncharacterized protein LOC119090433 n=1 Tax=Pollicipes pollicipes TaxID=41117 RepID=UPI0018851559|nr:uncharacterized protein LOC119090433 [Pollicipes pollicipes]